MMLVLVTMFISVSEGLPKTSYIKMIDVWLVFVLIVPFLEVLVVVFEFVSIFVIYVCLCDDSPLVERFFCTPSLI